MMNNPDDIKNKILDTHSSRQTKINSLSSVFSAPETHLSHIIDQMLDGKSPIVVWNIAPSDHFGVLHAVYCEKLKQLADLGCNCVVLIYDAYARDVCNATKKLGKQIEHNAIKLSKQILSKGISKEKIEFVLESYLRVGIDQNQLVKNMLSLSEIFRKSCNITSYDLAFYTLIEFYYEHLIDADIILAGEMDINKIWGALNNIDEISHVLHGYTPPLLISLPRMYNAKGVPLSSTNSNDSISTISSHGDIKKILQTSSSEFMECIFNFLYFPINNNVSVNGVNITNYDSLSAVENKQEIINRAYNFACSYFLGD